MSVFASCKGAVDSKINCLHKKCTSICKIYLCMTIMLLKIKPCLRLPSTISNPIESSFPSLFFKNIYPKTVVLSFVLGPYEDCRVDQLLKTNLSIIDYLNLHSHYLHNFFYITLAYYCFLSNCPIDQLLDSHSPMTYSNHPMDHLIHPSYPSLQ